MHDSFTNKKVNIKQEREKSNDRVHRSLMQFTISPADNHNSRKLRPLNVIS
jgi:hypothetical protein